LRLVVVSSRFPYPLITGDRLRLFHQIRLLSKTWDICLISISDSKVKPEHRTELEKYCKEVHVFSLPKWKSAASLSRNVFKTLPFQVSYFYDKQIHKEIKRVVDAYKADIAFFQLIRTALYARDIGIPAVIDFMDSFSTIAERDAEFSSGLRSIIFRNEAKKLREFESEIAQLFVGRTIISQNDKELLGLADLKVISNGVDVDYFKPEDDITEFDLCFIGNLGYAPNQRAVENLVKKILPRIVYKNPHVTLLIAGARPSHKIQAMSNKHISVMGDVEDIRNAYKLCKLFIAPIYTGAGQQNKILEAMAMGLPCITTHIVNSSIGASSEEIKIGFSNTDFVNHAIDLLYDKNSYIEQRYRGLELVRTRFSWISQVNKLSDYFNECLNETSV